MPDQNMKILAVDDFSTMRRIVRNILRQLGYNNISEAEDGVAALESLKHEPVDFVIPDWNMPNMTGLELLKAIRADANLKDIPVPDGYGGSAKGECRRSREGENRYDFFVRQPTRTTIPAFPCPPLRNRYVSRVDTLL